VIEILSLWRSPLDQIAFAEANALPNRQPHCSIGYAEDFSAMTIFNYGYYVTNASGNLDTALADMFLAMNPGPYGFGGTAFISQTSFPAGTAVHASTNGFTVPDQCNIIGSGLGGFALAGATSFYHFVIDYTNGSIFLNCGGNYTSGGKYFRDLAFNGTALGGKTGDTCILAATENCRAVNCTFTDIPLAFDAQGDGCALEQCTIYYSQFGGTTAVIIAGARCGVFGPGEIFQQPQNPGGTGGPANCTAISIEGAEHAVIADVHLSEWNIGVDFAQAVGAQHTDIRNCEIQSWQSALNIKLPANTSGSTTDIEVRTCLLAKSDVSNDLTAVVLIDPQLTTHNLNSQLSGITLLDCTVINAAASNTTAQHGLQIAGGTNIKVIGGTYSNNSQVGGAGIAITGACGDVQIIGANLQPSYPWAGTTKGPSLNYQQYGLLVTAPPTGTVYVADCDLTGYTNTSPPNPQQAVSVTVTLTRGLFIYNCPGYNDQGTTLNGNVPPTAVTNSAATCTNPYFGPSVILFSNATPVTLHIFGQTITEDFGIIFLPSPYDIFYFSGTPPMSFSWIGK
jgi:hypothetical protein